MLAAIATTLLLAAVPPEMAPWAQPAPPVHVAGPVYFVGTKGIGVYLITTSAGNILIDGGLPGSGPAIAASIRKLGFKPEEIRFLLSTHAHVDHAGTLAYFQKLSHARVLAMAPDDQLLASGGKLDYVFAGKPEFQFDPVKTDQVLKDGDVIGLGGVTLRALHTPGHTRGCTTWMTTIEDHEKSYKVVFPGSTTINPGTRLTHDPSYPGIADDYRKSIETLASLTPDIFLTGHPSACGLDEKRKRVAKEGAAAFVDPDGYRAYVASQKANLEEAIAKERP